MGVAVITVSGRKTRPPILSNRDNNVIVNTEITKVCGGGKVLSLLKMLIFFASTLFGGFPGKSVTLLVRWCNSIHIILLGRAFCAKLCKYWKIHFAENNAENNSYNFTHASSKSRCVTTKEECLAPVYGDLHSESPAAQLSGVCWSP